MSNIKAGADIHAGDGGYSLGTQEGYEAFVKARNKPTLYLIRGVPGSGKSTFAQSLLDKFVVQRAYFAWGINLCVNEPTNYEGEYKDQITVNVYCNCISMFGEDLYNYANRTMHEAMKNVPMFHNDAMNSTFYFEPHQVENGLDAVVAWYNEVKAKGDTILKQKRKEELERQLKELEN